MIIQCGECGTRYRFDEALILGEGVWVRCSRCQEVSFQENPSPTGQEYAEVKEASVFRSDPQAGDPSVETTQEIQNGKGPERQKHQSLRKIIAYAAVLLLMSGGLFFWFMPQAGKSLLDVIPGGSMLARYFGIETSPIMGGGIDFIDVKDSFVNNWVIGDLMVINGTAVNRNSHPVSNIRVKARLLDSEGQFVGDAEGNCGNFLSDEDLAKLTEKEIAERLSFPAGSGIRNAPIAPEGKMPFTIVFIRPPKKAVEFIVETVSVEKSTL